MRFRIILLTLLVVSNVPAVSAEQARKCARRVLILDSLGRNLSLDSISIAVFRSELSRQWSDPIDFYEIPLEASRIDKPEDDRAMIDFMADRLAANPVDLVVTFSAPAMQFAVRNRNRLFGETPLLFTFIEQRHLRPEFLTPQTAVVSMDYDLPELIEGILQVLPRTTTIGVVLGSSPLERFWRSEAQREFRRFADRVCFRWFDVATFDEIKREVATLPANSAVLYGSLYRDAAGVTFQYEEGLEGLRAVANAPIFVNSESDFGSGVVGGRLFPDRSIGVQAAAAALRILHGEPPSSITVPPLKSLPPVYDWRELDRWGISESLLPSGSTVRFRPPSMWQEFRGYVVGAVGLVALQAAMIAGLLWQGRRKRRAEDALSFSEQRLQLITNSLPALIAHVDRHQRYQFANRAYEKWFGLEQAQVLGRTIRDVVGEAMYGKVRPHVGRVLAGEHVVFSMEATLPGGMSRSLDAMYVPDRDDGGAIRGFYALVVDVTERTLAQREARRLLDELAHGNRVSMLGELAAALAHELNQPLTAIVSNAQAALRFLKVDRVDRGEVREILGDIAYDGTRAGEVIRRMRTLVKKERANFLPLDVNQVLREVVGLLRSDAAMHRVAIDLQLEPDLPPVNGDRIQLQQVVMNLLLNAFDSFPEGSPEPRTVLLQTRECGPEVQVKVRDQGAGIRAETLKCLFEPFHTSKSKGLGMGLSISRSILDVHGGRLWAENNPDGGATFSFTLPCHLVPAISVEVSDERVLAHGLCGG